MGYNLCVNSGETITCSATPPSLLSPLEDSLLRFGLLEPTERIAIDFKTLMNNGMPPPPTPDGGEQFGRIDTVADSRKKILDTMPPYSYTGDNHVNLALRASVPLVLSSHLNRGGNVKLGRERFSKIKTQEEYWRVDRGPPTIRTYDANVTPIQP